MIASWFDAREAAEFGTSLATKIVHANGPVAEGTRAAPLGDPAKTLQQLLRRADAQVQEIGRNIYKRAKLASSFKWKLIESGIDRDVAEHLTQTLVMRIAWNRDDAAAEAATYTDARQNDAIASKALLGQGTKLLDQGQFAQAVDAFTKLLAIEPENFDGLNKLGVALFRLDRFAEAEERFRQAVAAQPDSVEANGNLGAILSATGYHAQAEVFLRRALKSNPTHVDARLNLGMTLFAQGRAREADGCYKKVLKASPRHARALCGSASVAAVQGRIEEAESLYRKALEIKPKLPTAWAALASLRKMSAADAAWLAGAEQIRAQTATKREAADLCFAIGKYYDDIGDFAQAFRNYQRGNELSKDFVGETYDRKARTAFVDEMIAAFTPQLIAAVGPGGSDSNVPVLVVGMMRSGTSLAEQIIASHRLASGAGELDFWARAALENEGAMKKGLLDGQSRKRLADAFLATLANHSSDAQRIVDKTPVNADFLGLIYSVFPRARIIHMQRNPIDACLSSYFQNFGSHLGVATDLTDLAHYYRQHHRLMSHWLSVLPAGTILTVPYEGLVADQELWTRKMLDFIGLEWDPQCLNFHENKRTVATASFRQVREPVYTASVRRWRNYEKFIGPLLSLKDLSA